MKKVLFLLMLSLCACHKTTQDTNTIDVAKTLIGKWQFASRVVVYYTANQEVARLNVTASTNAPDNSSTLTLPYYYQFTAAGSMTAYAYNTTTGKYDLDPNISGYTLTNDNKTLNLYTGQVLLIPFGLSVTDSNSLTLVNTNKLIAYRAADGTVKTADNSITTTYYTRMQ